MSMNEREKALDEALKKIEKDFGKGSIMRLGDHAKLNIESIPTGCLSLDMALGIGGIPKGRIIEIYGPESSGKTTLTLHIIAECQKKGGTAAFIDAEHALDPQYARNLGVDIDKLIVSQPDNGEQGLDIAEALVRSGAVDLVVIDSVAALVPKTEIEGAMGDATIGLQARLMSQAMRKLSGVISKTNSTVVFINQLREKIGIMFGSPETTTGGKALKFYSSVRLDIRKFDVIKQKEETAVGKKEDVIVGNRVRVKVVKNKVAPPFKVVEFDIMYGTGISKEGDILDVAVDRGIVEKAGAWFSYKGEKLGQGRENVKQLFKEKPELMEEIELKVREASKKEDEALEAEAEQNKEE